MNEPEIKIVLTEKSSNYTAFSEGDIPRENKIAVEEFFKEKTSKSQKSRSKTVKSQTSKGLLPDIFDLVEKSDTESVYDALKAEGFVQSGDEFIPESDKQKEIRK